MKVEELEKYHLHIYNAREQLKQHVYKRSEEAFLEGDLARDALQTTDEIIARQALIRTGFSQCIGNNSSTHNGPLSDVTTGIIECSGFHIENVRFESRPGVWVTCNMYIPSSSSGPSPAILFLCGHHDRGKHDPEYQIVCQHLVQAGLIVLAVDPMGQGERLQYYEKEVGKSVIGPGVLEHEYAGTQCYPLGDSLATYFVFDAMRAIDYLCSRAEVDPARIGVTGNSGGGMQASMVMMSDPRIAAAAPATFITSRRAFLYADRAQDAEQIWPGFSALSFDHEDILLAIAPKPLLVLSAEYDFFPIEGTRSTVERVRRFWDAFGAGESLRLFTDKAVHAYTPRMAVEAATFFAEHLRGEKLQNFSPTIEVLEPSRLCSATDGQILADPSINSRACTIHDEIHHKALRLEQNRKTLPKGETEQLALSWLRNVVHKDRRGCELNPRLYMLDAQMEELSVYNAMWRAQPDLFNHAMIFRDTRRITERLPITIAVWDGGTRRLQPHWAWLREACAAGRSVMVLDVSGSGVLMPHSFHNKDPLSVFEVIHKLTVDLFWLGDSMAALRIFDVLRALDMAAVLPMTDSEDIQLYGSGRQGLYTRLASHLDGRVSHMDWENSLPSVSSLVKAKYYDSQNLVSLLIPGMLQLFDLPELEAAAGTKQHDGTMR